MNAAAMLRPVTARPFHLPSGCCTRTSADPSSTSMDWYVLPMRSWILFMDTISRICYCVFARKPLPRSMKASAFQKVNFLRDIKADFNDLSRIYFPGCDFHNFTGLDKERIESDIEEDFRRAYLGIRKLPIKARFGVYVAYKYYYSLFRKIKNTEPQNIMEARIRIPNYHKALIVFRASIKNGLRLIE
jgi:hypothetical protein